MFGRGKDKRDALASQVGQLQAEVERLVSHVRTLETEQELMHAQVRKWMRRAVAAEGHQERRGGAAPSRAATPLPLPQRPRSQSNVEMRIYARKLEEYVASLAGGAGAARAPMLSDPAFIEQTTPGVEPQPAVNGAAEQEGA